MIQIRRNVFETNSSSTHSITMCMSSDYDLWRKNKVWFIDRYDAKFFPWNALIDYITKNHIVEAEDIQTLKEHYDRDDMETVEDMLADYEIYTYNSWCDKRHPEFERFTDKFTTPSGETVVSFGYYGESY